MHKNTLQNNLRNGWIDLIRGISILFVILLHINIRIPFDKTPIGKIMPSFLTNILFHSGYYGVIIFFVVSGFLITNSILEKWGGLPNIHCGEFYQLRFARIAPCLIALLFLLSLFHMLRLTGFIITTTSLQNAIFSALTFHINLLEAKTGYLPASWDVLWSLSIEEMFYLFFPLFCLFIRNERIFKITMLLFIILGPFARNNANEIWGDHSYLSCMDGIAIGCLAALYINSHKTNDKFFSSYLIIGLALSTLIFFFRHLTSYLGITKIGLNVTMLEIGIAFILIALYRKSMASKIRFLNLLRWFGKNSYEIYLTHGFIVLTLSALFYKLRIPMVAAPLWYVLILVFSGIVGILVSRYFSEPMNKILRFKSSSNVKNAAISR